MTRLKKYQRGIIAFCLVVSLAVPPSLVLSVGMSFVEPSLAYAEGEVSVELPSDSSGAEQSFDPASVGSEGSSGSTTTTSGGNIDYGPGGYIVDGALSASAGSDSNYSSDGSNYSSDGSNYSSDGSNYSSDGSNYSSDGSNYSSDGSNYSSDGSNYSSDGSNYSSDGSNYSSDGSNYSSDGSNYSSDGSNYSSDGSNYSSDDSNYSSDGSNDSSDGSNYSSDGSNYSSIGSDNSSLPLVTFPSPMENVAASPVLPMVPPLTFAAVLTPNPSQFPQGLIPIGSGRTFVPSLLPFDPNRQEFVIIDLQGNRLPMGPFMGIVGPMQRTWDDQGRYLIYGDNFRGTYVFDWATGTATLTGYDGAVTRWGGIRSYTSVELLDPANVGFDSDWRFSIVANVRGYQMLEAGSVVRMLDTELRPVRITDPAVGTYTMDWKSRTAVLTNNSGVIIKTWGYLDTTNRDGRETIVSGVTGFKTVHEAGGITNYMDENGDIFRTDTPHGTAKFLYDGQHHVIKQWNPARETFDFAWIKDSGTGTWTLDHATSTRQVSGGVETRIWSAPNVLGSGAIYTDGNIGGVLTTRIQYTDGRVEEFDDSGKLIRQVASDGHLTLTVVPGVGTYRINWSTNTATLTDVNGRVTTWGGVSDVVGSGNDGRVLIVENVRGSFVSSRLMRLDGSYQDFNAQGEVISERTVSGDLIGYDRSDPTNLKISVTSAATGEMTAYINCTTPPASNLGPDSLYVAPISSTSYGGTIAYVQMSDAHGGWYRKTFGTSLNDIPRVDYSNGDSIALSNQANTTLPGGATAVTYTAIVTRNGSAPETYTGVVGLNVSAAGITIKTAVSALTGTAFNKYEEIVYSGTPSGLKLMEKRMYMRWYSWQDPSAYSLGRKTVYQYDAQGQFANYQVMEFLRGTDILGDVTEIRTYNSFVAASGDWVQKNVMNFGVWYDNSNGQDIVTVYRNGDSSTIVSRSVAGFKWATPNKIENFTMTMNGVSWSVDINVMDAGQMNTGSFSDGDRVFGPGQYAVMRYLLPAGGASIAFTKVYALGAGPMTRSEIVLKLTALAGLDRNSMQGVLASYDPKNLDRSYYDDQGRLTVQHTIDDYYGGANVRTLRRTYNADGSDKTTVEYFRAGFSGSRDLMNDADSNGVPLSFTYDVSAADLIGVFDANSFTGNGLVDGWDQGTLDPIRAKLGQGLTVTREEWVTALNSALKVRMRASDYQAAYANPVIASSLDTAEKNFLQGVTVESNVLTLSQLLQLTHLNRRLLEFYYPQQIEKTCGPLVERIVRTYDDQGRLKKEVSRTLRSPLATGLGTFETVTLYEYPLTGVTVARTYSGTFEGETPEAKNVLLRAVRTTVSSHPTAGWRTESLETTVGGASPITVVRVVDDHGRTMTETGPNDRVLPTGVSVTSSYIYDGKGLLSNVQHRDATGTLVLEEFYSPDTTFGFKSTLTRAERHIGGRLDSKTWYRLSRLHSADNERIPVKDIMILYANGVDRTVDKVLAFSYYRQGDIISQNGRSAYNATYMAMHDCNIETYTTNATVTAQSIVSSYQNGTAGFPVNLRESSYSFGGANTPGVSFPSGMVLNNTYTPYLPGGVVLRDSTIGTYGPTSVTLGQTIYAAPIGTGTYVGYSNVVNSGVTTQVPFVYSFSVVSSLNPQPLPPGTVFTQYSVNGPRPGEVLTIYYIQRTDVSLNVTLPTHLSPG